MMGFSSAGGTLTAIVPASGVRIWRRFPRRSDRVVADEVFHDHDVTRLRYSKVGFAVTIRPNACGPW